MSPPVLRDVVERVQAHRMDLQHLGVQTLAVFGSVARGDAGPESDVDVLVEFDDRGSYAKVEEFLVDLFGRKVDLVPRHAVRRQLKQRVESEAIELLPEFKPREYMPPKQPREWKMFIEDMIKGTETIVAKTAGQTLDSLLRDEDRLQVIAWNFNVIGEGERNTPAPVKEAHPEIPWEPIRAMRNRVVHHYFEIDARIVLQVANGELPQVLVALRNLLAET